MDPAILVAFALAFKVLALTLPLALVGGGGWLLFKRSRLGRTLVEQVTDGAETQAVVQALVDHVQQLEAQLGELQERVDFAERLLSRPGPDPRTDGAAERLPTPPEPHPIG
jgi:hypothetical protein